MGIVYVLCILYTSTTYIIYIHKIMLYINGLYIHKNAHMVFRKCVNGYPFIS